ncbi:DUF3560 domain-containing protein, partial [Pseudomonadales bacterium]|nr:DUF3560 domain-containing protein [Pseudomonadales bacterium]
SRSRCASTMITGGSGFNVRRNDKANNVAHNRMTEYLDWHKKAIKRLEKKYNPALAYTGIRSGDSDAIEKLEAKLEGLIKDQERMKLFNKLVRKHIGKKAEKLTDETRQNLVDALIENGLSSNEESAAKLITPDYAGRIVLSYQLTNNNATIRNTKKRLEHLKLTKAKETTNETANGVNIERNHDENRLRLKFDDKPSKAIRTVLKSNGFRWADSLEVWQGYMTCDGYKLQNVLDAIESEA